MRPGLGAWARVRHLAWAHPEWWALALAAAAWCVLLAAAWTGHGAAGAHAHGHAHAARDVATSVLTDLAHWQLMVVAMMLPVIVPSLRVAAFRSLWRRRHRAMAGFLLGYLAVWALLGLAVCLALTRFPWLTDTWGGVAAAAAFVCAAGWQWTRLKRRSLVACHRTIPLAPRGWRADRDCVELGWRIGGSCCVGCWVLMVACTLAGHSPLALAACAGIGLVERYSWRPDMTWISLGILALAAVFAATG